MLPKLMRRALPLTGLLVALVAAALLASAPAEAEHDNTCHPPPGSGVFAVWVTVGLFQVTDDSAGRQSLVLNLGRGHATAHAVLGDGASNTVLVGEGVPRLQCADLDGDGVVGFTELDVELHGRHARRPGVVRVLVVPDVVEADTTGWYSAKAYVTVGGDVVEMDGAILVVAAVDGPMP